MYIDTNSTVVTTVPYNQSSTDYPAGRRRRDDAAEGAVG